MNYWVDLLAGFIKSFFDFDFKMDIPVERLLGRFFKKAVLADVLAESLIRFLNSCSAC